MAMNVGRFRFGAVVSATVFLVVASAASAGDWTYWRGPAMNGTSPETGLPTEWDPDGGPDSNVLWKREDLGTRSSPVVMNDRVYFLARHNAETPQEQEKVVCLNAENGETVWENRFNLFLTDVPDTRVAWSAVVADPETNQVYALGVCGLFQCLDAATGETVWKKSLSEEYGLLSTYGGRTNMPIVVGDTVIVSAVVIGWGEMAKPAHRFIGFDKRTGEARWFNGTRLLPYDTTYSGPVLTVFGDRPAIVFGSGDGGVHAFEPLTGRPIWKYDVSTRGINTTPLVDHTTGRVYCGHSEENVGSTEMGALFALDGNAAGDLSGKAIWNRQELFCGKSAPLLLGDRLYAIDDRAKLHILNPETGEEVGSQRMGTMQRVSPVAADGKIFTAEANGRIYTLIPDGDGVEMALKERLPRGEECHGSPAIANGRLFWPTTGAMYCIGNDQSLAAAETVQDDPAMPAVDLQNRDGEPVQLQVVPAEILIGPGETVDYSVRLYNDLGQFVRDANADEVAFELTTSEGTPVADGGEASVSFENGSLSVTGREFVAYDVRASLKGTDLTGRGRVRYEPELDWQFDFATGRVPEPWVGAAYRMVCLDGALLAELQESDPTAADLYLLIGSSFINSGAPKLTYDDSTPRLGYTSILRFFGIETGPNRPANLEEAKQRFDSSMQTLVDRGIFDKYEWSTWTRSEGADPQPRLTVSGFGDREPEDGVLVKIRTIPKGARSQSWMGSPDLSDYTIEADVKGLSRDGKLPDIGLIAQRYTLDLMGASQQLQIRTWTPQLYVARSTPIEWQADTWYRLKFMATTEGDEAVLRGKVWPRGQAEPSEWTVTARDSLPNENGSPGLFGNAKDAEILYDNIRVTSNAKN